MIVFFQNQEQEEVDILSKNVKFLFIVIIYYRFIFIFKYIVNDPILRGTIFLIGQIKR
jgi:uncharacterized MAPEG superfamily protein